MVNLVHSTDIGQGLQILAGGKLVTIDFVAGPVPPAGPPTGNDPKFYVDTLTGVLYFWDGVTWRAVAADSAATAPPPDICTLSGASGQEISSIDPSVDAVALCIDNGTGGRKTVRLPLDKLPGPVAQQAPVPLGAQFLEYELVPGATYNFTVANFRVSPDATALLAWQVSPDAGATWFSTDYTGGGNTGLSSGYTGVGALTGSGSGVIHVPMATDTDPYVDVAAWTSQHPSTASSTYAKTLVWRSTPAAANRIRFFPSATTGSAPSGLIFNTGFRLSLWRVS